MNISVAGFGYTWIDSFNSERSFNPRHASTNCEIVVVLIQPSVFDPVTVNIVEAIGATATVEPSCVNVDHEYVRAPLAVIVADSPTQIVVLELSTVMVGLGFTVTVIAVLLALTVQVDASA